MVIEGRKTMKLFEKHNGEKKDSGETIAHKKVKRTPEIAKLDEKIDEQIAEIEQSFMEIGKIYYEEYKNPEHDKLIPICSVIDEAQKTIKICEKQQMLLQGFKQCPKCKAQLSLDSVFCNKCGEKVDSEDGVSDEDMENFAAENLKPIKCPDCGTENTGDTIFCINCGAKLR